MSSLYIQEPPTCGKVVLKTTVGDIDIELWSKETPKACRNFVQLCLEKYYDGTIFHRVIKGFIAQGGDPNGDGSGGESIYGEPFKDEFHSRLRFVRRGLVAMANGGKDDNGSQFFFTLGSCPELQKKNTIFGKVSGDTLFNMLKLEEGLFDDNDRPAYPHKIISSEVLMNPFPDIVPRTKVTLENVEAPKLKPKEQKNFKLLSFGEEAEEDETEVETATNALKGKSKSIHDLIEDPKLSSVSAAGLYDIKENNAESLEHIKKKLKVDNKPKIIVPKPKDEEKHKAKLDERKKIQDEIKMLVKELRQKNKPEDNEPKVIPAEEPEDEFSKAANPMVKEYLVERKTFKSKAKLIPSDKSEREKKTMELLAKFQKKIQSVNESVESSDKTKPKSDSDDEDDSWLAHSLNCSSGPILAKDANIKPSDWYDITDPRNPINQRKRKEKKT